MDLILLKTIAEIRYEIPESLNFRYKIIEKITDYSEKLPITTDGINLFIRKKSIGLVVESNRMGVDIFLPRSSRYALDNTVKVYKQINSVLNIQNITRIGFRTFWVVAVDTKMEELIKKFKKSFLCEKNSLVHESTDVAISLTLSKGNKKINYNTGPIGNEQALQLLAVDQKNLSQEQVKRIPKVGIFVDYDYYSLENHKFNDTYFLDFMTKAIKTAEKDVETTVKNIKEVKNE